MTDNNRLLKIAGTWIPNPDPSSWNPVRYKTWTEGSGRTASGLNTGAIKYRKWKLGDLTWSNLREADEKFIEETIEQAEDSYGGFFPVEFYHRGGYIAVTMNASDFSAAGISNVGGEIYYPKCTVSLVER
ncbi:MAG: hypothetical protein IJ723_04245 [Ruminococcus sp.]|nr:hypothetical protein [Ruminococcus sp.]